MGSDALSTVSFVLIVGSSAIMVVLAIGAMLGTPRFVRAMAKRRQSRRLDRLLAAVPPGQRDVVVYWDRYRDLGKLEIMARAEPRGLLYVDQAITPDGWALNFSRG
jgi:hypothetical protein